MLLLDNQLSGNSGFWTTPHHNSQQGTHVSLESSLPTVPTTDIQAIQQDILETGPGYKTHMFSSCQDGNLVTGQFIHLFNDLNVSLSG